MFAANVELKYTPKVEKYDAFSLLNTSPTLVAGGTLAAGETVDYTFTKKGNTKDVYLAWQYRQDDPKSTSVTVNITSTNGAVLKNTKDTAKKIAYKVTLATDLETGSKNSAVEAISGTLNETTKTVSFNFKNVQESGIWPLEFYGCVKLTFELTGDTDSTYLNDIYNDTLTIEIAPTV